MKTIITGSRIALPRHVRVAIQRCPWKITSVVCGMARGADIFGKYWADENGIPVHEFPADWDTFGKRAWHIRNCEMARNAEALIAVWDGKSKGTKHMIMEATNLGLLTHIYIYE